MMNRQILPKTGFYLWHLSFCGPSYESEGTLSSCGHIWDRKISFPESGLSWFPAFWWEAFVVAEPVSSHKPLMSTDCRVTSLCSAIAHDVEEVSLTSLDAEHLVHLEAWGGWSFPSVPWSPSVFFLFETWSGSKTTETLLLYLLGGEGSSWTFLLGWPSFPGLYTPCIRLPRWVIACSSHLLLLLSLVFSSWYFPLHHLASWGTDWPGGTLLCTGQS